MSWERGPLWSKARLYFQRAFDESREDPLFGLWCSFGLELLARAAVASVSPTLLAEPDHEQKNLLHALNRGVERSARVSIGTARVVALCRTLFREFTEDDAKAVLALANRRNEELHSGTAAFEEYPPKQWLVGFYHACRSLSTSIDESLETLFGVDEAKVAEEVIAEISNDVRQRVLSSIAAHRKVFDGKPSDEKAALTERAKKLGEQLVYERNHRCVCPSCGCDAFLKGEPFGPERVTNATDHIEVRQAVTPTSFSCSACGLRLTGYSEVDAAQLGGQYTRTTYFQPDQYYGLIDPDTFDPTDMINDYLKDNPDIIEEHVEKRIARGFEEYDNE